MALYFRDNILAEFTRYSGCPDPTFSLAATYERAIFRLLTYISNRNAGRAVIDEIDRAFGTLTISPPGPSAPAVQEYMKPTGMRVRQWNPGATAGATGSRSTSIRRAPLFQWAPASRGTEWVQARVPGVRASRPSAWHGSNSVIRFHPSVWPGVSSRNTKGAGNRADEALFHEMFHSLRQLRHLETNIQYGTSAPSSMQGYETFEEFVCILVTNYYCAEEGRPLRADHRGFRVLEGNRQTWRNWPQDRELQRLLRQFFQQQTGLARRLSQEAHNPYEFDPVGHHILLSDLHDPGSWDI